MLLQSAGRTFLSCECHYVCAWKCWMISLVWGVAFVQRLHKHFNLIWMQHTVHLQNSPAKWLWDCDCDQASRGWNWKQRVLADIFAPFRVLYVSAIVFSSILLRSFSLISYGKRCIQMTALSFLSLSVEFCALSKAASVPCSVISAVTVIEAWVCLCGRIPIWTFLAAKIYQQLFFTCHLWCHFKLF